MCTVQYVQYQSALGDLILPVGESDRSLATMCVRVAYVKARQGKARDIMYCVDVM